jgi:hypothetical protein
MGDRVDGEDIRSVSPFAMMRPGIADVAICHIMYHTCHHLLATTPRSDVPLQQHREGCMSSQVVAFVKIIIVSVLVPSLSSSLSCVLLVTHSQTSSRLERAKHHDTVARSSPQPDFLLPLENRRYPLL